MNQFKVNGVERPSPIQNDSSLGELFEYVHRKLSNDQAVVSTILINGVEIQASQEPELSKIPASDIGSFEVLMSHPREMAEETLQVLKVFSERLIEMSIQTSRAQGIEMEKGFLKLVDGIQTFVDTVANVKEVLKIQRLEAVDRLESSLMAILNDLLVAQQTNDDALRIQILGETMPKNLESWKLAGIPALIRSRDN
jgi:hypothetical protein